MEVFGTVTENGIKCDKYVTAQWYKDNKGRTVSIKPLGGKRSDKQNSLYWAYLRICANTTGNEPEDLHKEFKLRFIGYTEQVILGKKRAKLKSTTTLSKTDFGEYLDKVELLMIQMANCPIPEDWKLKMIENHKQKIN